jgi:hypothetical protein
MVLHGDSYIINHEYIMVFMGRSSVVLSIETRERLEMLDEMHSVESRAY